MMKSTKLYIDLGTANTLIYLRGKGLVLNEPSYLTVRDDGETPEEVVAVGHEAKAMLGRTPDHLRVFRPLKEGVIADFDRTVLMLKGFLERIRRWFSVISPRIVISLPCRVSQAERNAVEQAARSIGASDVKLIQEPVAAAIGVGLPILKSTGSMIVDIGGGTSEVAVISCGGIVYSNSARVGGDHMDEAIVEFLRQKYNFSIGLQTAESLKHELADALKPSVLNTISVKGLDLTSGLPTRREVSSLDVHRAVDPVLRVIMRAIQDALENTPPELSGDLAATGLVIAGGGALVRNIDQRIFNEMGMKVQIPNSPLISIGEGGARTLEEDSLLEAIAI